MTSCRSTDEAADGAGRLRAVFDQSYRPLFAYVLRRVDNPHIAEDIVAEVYLVAWRRIAEVPPGPESLPWLIGVARRVMANSRRGDARRHRLLAKLGRQTEVPSDEIDVRQAGSETRHTVTSAMARLRPADLEVLQLAMWENLPHAQIALVLGCTVNAVDIRLHRARRALRAVLEKDNGHSGHLSASAQLHRNCRGSNE